MPPAYSAPTTLPALVPDTTAGARPLASSILMTPIWAKPFTAPPPRARPILMGATGVPGTVGVDSGVAAEGLGGLLPQAASPARLRYTSGRKRAFRRMPGILLSDDEIRGGQYSGRGLTAAGPQALGFSKPPIPCTASRKNPQTASMR